MQPKIVFRSNGEVQTYFGNESNLLLWLPEAEILEQDKVTTMFSLAKFFTYYREFFGRIYYQKTVATIEAILDYADKKDLTTHQLSYCLATAYHEAKDAKHPHDFYPLEERGSRQYLLRYWNNSLLRKWLGNRSEEDAIKYKGRGLVQLTGRGNYEKFDLEETPEKLLEIKTSVEVLIDGIMKGMFTGAKLIKYINKDNLDYYNARRTVNGLDKAGIIAEYARRFETILEKSKL